MSTVSVLKACARASTLRPEPEAARATVLTIGAIGVALISSCPLCFRFFLPAFDSFLDSQGGYDERGGRVGPPPSEPDVEADAEERGGGGIGAEGGLGGVGDQGAIAQSLSGAALGNGRAGI